MRTDRDLQFLFAALLLWMFGVGLYEGLVPIFARQLGASPVQLGTLYTVRQLSLAGGYLIGWVIADRFSRRTIFVASWLLGAPVPLMLAAATSYMWLLPGLVLYHLTFFGLPAIHAFLTQRVPADRLASTFGAMGTITSMGFLISPTLGGLIADRWGIRATLVVAAALYGLSVALILRVRRDTAPAAMSATAPAPSWGDLIRLLPVLSVSVGVTLAITITDPYAPPFLREVRGLSLSAIGLLGSMMAVGGVAFTGIAGRLGDRFGIPVALGGALAMQAVGNLLTVYGPTALLPLFAVLRTRSPMANLSQALVGSRAPAQMVGRLFAMAGMLSALVASVGVFAGGFAYRLDPAAPLLISSGLAAGIACTLLLFRRAAAVRPAAAPPESEVAAAGASARSSGSR